MSRYIARRLLMMVGILLGVLTITFLLSRVLPGSPVEMMLGAKPTPEQIEAAREELGLDRPLSQQFVTYVWQALQGDFGTSLRTSRPVSSEILLRMTATLELVTIAMLIAIVIGVPLGIVSAVRRDTWRDHGARVFSIAGMALPVFLVGMLLQMIFYGMLDWLPLQGRIDRNILLDAQFDAVTGFYLIDTLLAGDMAAFRSALSHMLLPVATLTLAALATVTRIARNMMIEALGEDFVRTAHAYGLPARRIHYRYALKATLIPLLTVIGLTYGYMLGGSVVVEYVFDWPGLGAYIVGSLINNDFPAVMGVTLFLATSYLLVNLVVDLLYYAVDPRLRQS